MKVSELIELLNEQDPEAEVLLMMQQSWPFECSLKGVTSREEILDSSDDIDDELGDGCHRKDVFLVEGRQLRYGSKTAWELV